MLPVRRGKDLLGPGIVLTAASVTPADPPPGRTAAVTVGHLAGDPDPGRDSGEPFAAIHENGERGTGGARRVEAV